MANNKAYMHTSRADNPVRKNTVVTKNVSRTHTLRTDDTCQVWNKSVKKCKSSSSHKHTCAIWQIIKHYMHTSRADNSVRKNMVVTKNVSRTCTLHKDDTCKVWNQTGRKCKSSSLHKHKRDRTPDRPTDRPTDKPTDRPTDRQGDSYIPPPKLRLRGYNKWKTWFIFKFSFFVS